MLFCERDKFSLPQFHYSNKVTHMFLWSHSTRHLDSSRLVAARNLRLILFSFSCFFSILITLTWLWRTDQEEVIEIFSAYSYPKTNVENVNNSCKSKIPWIHFSSLFLSPSETWYFSFDLYWKIIKNLSSVSNGSPPTKAKRNIFIKTSNFIAHEKLCKKSYWKKNSLRQA